MCFTRKGFVDTPMFAAQNCIYIQAVGGDMLQIDHQKGFVLSTRRHPAILVKYAMNGVLERMSGDGKKEGKDPEVQMQLPTCQRIRPCWLPRTRGT